LLYKNTNIRIYRTTILPVFYGCGTWSLTLREDQRLRVLQNRVLRRIFGPKRDETTEEWRRLHNEELYDLCSTRVIKSIRKRLQERRYAYRVLVRKPEGKRPLGRGMCRWEDNTKLDLQEIG
jgi:hypothetical protein